MKTKVFERLKPKAASYGFNEEELKGVSDYIAGILQPDATDETIDQEIERVVPLLKLSQSASHRAIENFKTQFAKEHPNNNPPTPPTPPAPPAPETPKTEPETVPDWFKKYQQTKDEETATLKAQLEQMRAEKANEAFSARALAGLKDVDSNYYELLLKGRTFKDEAEVDTFVNDVKAGWDKLVQARGIQVQTGVTPPGGGGPAPTTPSDDVKARIAEREKQVITSPIRGLEKPQ